MDKIESLIELLFKLGDGGGWMGKDKTCFYLDSGWVSIEDLKKLLEENKLEIN